MAKPRVFVSSTFFDLRSMRASLERFVKEMGYDPILFERGHIAWTKDDALESSCYREIHTCDILIAIIGGKFGTQSRNNESSITQNEIKEAYNQGKQVYLFVDKSVHSEYHTYQKNKHIAGFTPVSVDNNKIFDFINDIYNMHVGNPVEPFETVEDIIRYLREQWAGLFQRLLATNSRKMEGELISDIKNSSETLRSLVNVLIKEKENPGQVNEILMLHHPAFEAIKKAAGISYRVVFFNFEELKRLLIARSYRLDEDYSPEGYFDFDNNKTKKCIRIDERIFENEALKVISPADWKTDYIEVISLNTSSSSEDDPF